MTVFGNILWAVPGTAPRLKTLYLNPAKGNPQFRNPRHVLNLSYDWFLWLKKNGSQSLTPQLVTKAKQIDIHKVLRTMTLTQEPVSKSSLLLLCPFMLCLFILPDFVDFTHLANFSIESQGHIFPPCLNWNMRLQKSSTMSRINYHSFSALRISKTVPE